MGGVSRKSLESGLKKVTVWTGLKIMLEHLIYLKKIKKSGSKELNGV